MQLRRCAKGGQEKPPPRGTVHVSRDMREGLAPIPWMIDTLRAGMSASDILRQHSRDAITLSSAVGGMLLAHCSRSAPTLRISCEGRAGR